MPVSFRGSGSVPKYAKSTTVLKSGSTINSVNVTINYSGTLKFFVCANGSTASWEEVTNVSNGTRIQHTFSTTGDSVRWQALLGIGCRVNKIVMSIAS